MIKKCEVYVRGAYGPGNLGDDLLLVVIISILFRRFKKEDVVVGVSDVELARLLFPGPQYVNLKTPVVANHLIYGGGGQFFSFLKAGLSAEVEDKGFLPSLRLFFKRNRKISDAIVRLYFCFLGFPESLVRCRYLSSYSIGVGPFEVEGKGLKRFNKFIKQADYISVRDSSSKLQVDSRLQSENKNFEAVLFPDPTYDSEMWFSGRPAILASRDNYISYIVRDWRFNDSGADKIDLMFEHADKMKVLGRKVRFVIFNIEDDKEMLKRTQGNHRLIYRALDTSPSEFIRDLIEGSSAILSARAHGVWLPSILGCPVLAIEIEPKLKYVVNSLGQGGSLSSAEDLNVLDNDFRKYEVGLDSLKGMLEPVVHRNRDLARDASDTYIKWIDSL